MRVRNFLSVAFFLLCCFSCSKKMDYDAMAKDLCKCMEPLAQMNDQILEATRLNDSLVLEKLITEIDRVAEESERCALSLDNKYGTVPAEEEAKAEAAFKKACPKIAEIME